MLEFLNNNAGVITLFFTAVVAIATVFYVRLTSNLVNETIELRKAQTQPQLSVSILPRDPEVWIVDMIIENVGNGAAYNIQINPSSNFEMRENREFINIGFIKNDYKYFAPHQRLKFFFTNLVDKKEEKENVKFDIKVKYEDHSGKVYETIYKINLAEFYGIPRYGNPPIYDLSETLKNIDKNINKLVNEKINVNVYNEEDRVRIDKEQKEQLEKDYKRLKEEGRI